MIIHRSTVEHVMILQAAQQNPCVQLKIEGYDLFSEYFLRRSCFFIFGHCNIPHGFELRLGFITSHGAARIAASLRRNTKLQALHLGKLEDPNLTRILQTVEANTCLRVSLSLQTFLLGNKLLLFQSSTFWNTHHPSQYLELRNPSFTEESFRPICQALIHSNTVSKLRLNRCSFTDLESANLFRQLLETKPNLQLLSIRSCSFPGNSIFCAASFHAASLCAQLSTALFRTDALWPEYLFPRPNFGALLSAGIWNASVTDTFIQTSNFSLC